MPFCSSAGSESIFSITGRWCGLVELGIIMDAQVLSSLSNKNLKLLSCMSSFKKKHHVTELHIQCCHNLYLNCSIVSVLGRMISGFTFLIAPVLDYRFVDQ